MSTTHHLQTDRQTEQANRTLEDMLRAYVNYKQDNWDDCLAAAEFAYNNSVQASTGFSPFFLNNSQDPLTPSTLLIQPENPSQVASTEDFLSSWCTNIQRAKDAVFPAQEWQADNANRCRRNKTFKEGNQVMLSTAHLQLPSEKQRPLKKLQAKFISPYKVQTVISSTAYRLRLPHTLRIHPVFHISLLKQYNPTPEDFASRSTVPPPPVQVQDSQEPEYEVEAILDKRRHRRQVQYLVLWKGYPLHDATWEPLANLQYAQDLINKYEHCYWTFFLLLFLPLALS